MFCQKVKFLMHLAKLNVWATSLGEQDLKALSAKIPFLLVGSDTIRSKIVLVLSTNDHKNNLMHTI